MRRYLFAVLSTLALAATLPAVAVAHDHGRDRHDRGRDRFELRHRHHRRVEHFRARRAAAATTPADAGTVKSFKAGVLTIALNDGSTVSGIVNRRTEVACEAMDHRFRSDDGGPGPSGGGGGDRGDRHDQSDARGGDNDANDDNGNDANDNDANDNQGPTCAMALRTPGTHVRDATLILTGAGAVWDRVELDV